MTTSNHDENWPYVEQFTPAHAAGQQQRLGHLPLFQDIGLRLDNVAKDYTKISMTPSTDLVQPKGMFQGGMLATLVDTVAGQALRTTLKDDHDAVTIHLDAKYFRPVSSERVFAEGLVVRKGRSLAHIDVAVVSEQGALVARGWCVLKLSRRRETDCPLDHLPEAKPPALPESACGELQGGMGI